jgi:NAD(P)-dependent dehydrogenase (short-subunit alcohol dehydrogenase family)
MLHEKLVGVDRGRPRFCRASVMSRVYQKRVNLNRFFLKIFATLERMRPLLAKCTSPRAVGVTSFASIMQPDSELVKTCFSGNEEAALKIAESKDPGVYYASSKAAFARWIRRQAITADWVGAGILLNGIAPGIIVTPMTQPMLDDKA